MCACVSARAGAADRPPLVGVSHIAFHVSDVAKARAFYGGLLGYEEAAGKASPDGRVRFRINGRQYVEIVPGLVAGSDDRLDHVAFETTDLDALRAYLAEKDVKTPEVARDASHRTLRVVDPGWPRGRVRPAVRRVAGEAVGGRGSPPHLRAPPPHRPHRS